MEASGCVSGEIMSGPRSAEDSGSSDVNVLTRSSRHSYTFRSKLRTHTQHPFMVDTMVTGISAVTARSEVTDLKIISAD